MTFVNATKSALTRYADFSGRSGRSEFWFFILFINLIALPVIALMGFSPELGAAAYLVYTLAILPPTLAVSVRRLHDINRTGWWLLLYLIPIVGFIIVVIWATTAGTTGHNRYGHPANG